MKVTVRTKKLKSATLHLFERVVSSVNDLIEKFVDEIIICDDVELERYIHEIDSSISLTKSYGCKVLGKTIAKNEKTRVFLITDILVALEKDLVIRNKCQISPGKYSIQSLNTIFHEFGHAKNFYEFGELHIKRNHDNYVAFLNEHWKILRDEFLAETFCANLYQFEPSISWYGDFSDVVQEENFRAYADEYKLSKEGLNWHLAFQILHQYYFVPLFHKAGFLEGMKQFIDFENVSMCETVTKILNYQVSQNIYVPEDFNLLVLKKWDDFQIPDMLPQ